MTSQESCGKKGKRNKRIEKEESKLREAKAAELQARIESSRSVAMESKALNVCGILTIIVMYTIRLILNYTIVTIINATTIATSTTTITTTIKL